MLSEYKVIDAKEYEIFLSEDFLHLHLFSYDYEILNKFVIVDENTKKHCLPLIKDRLRGDFKIIQIKSGEKNKNLETAQHIWSKLIEYGCNRNDIIFNLGGGVIGDLGGFAAACFKRGVKFVQIPTTLLSMVDASVGGKLGLNFMGYKNNVGMFKHPDMIYINPTFLKTLPEREMKSGFAEMLKHALISDKKYWKTFKELKPADVKIEHIYESIKYKYKIIKKDFKEEGIRKLLNYGHTIGHALESYSLKNDKVPISHGEAIAAGMIIEGHISNSVFEFKGDDFEQIETAFLNLFGKYNFDGLTYKELKKMLLQDKKNEGKDIWFTLLCKIGHAVCEMDCEEVEIKNAVKYYRNIKI